METALETERKERVAIADKFAEEKRTRRLFELNSMARETFSHLSVDLETFGGDLMAIEVQDPKVYDRLMATLMAADELIGKSDLYSQIASARSESADPFEAKIEEIRQEQFSEMPKAQGWVEAMKVASSQYSDMARVYARGSQ